MFNKKFYCNKKILVTGHTGFKGGWLCTILKNAGADVTGYSLMPPCEPSLFLAADVQSGMRSVIGDIRDTEALNKVFEETKPEIVFHLAAQPIVRRGYYDPVYTFDTNIMGTVNVLECVRNAESVRSVVNVTTDKVYRSGGQHLYDENAPLGGYDPYAGSKACSEIITESYRHSFLSLKGCAVSAVRAGNAIGGGDFAKDRIIPDCVRAAFNNEAVAVRNPHSIRPYQHVLEPLGAYLMIAAAQYEDISLAGSYNVGPDNDDYIETGELADIFCRKWGGISWRTAYEENAPREEDILRLDCSKIKSVFGWRPAWNIDEAVDKTIEWTREYLRGGNVAEVMKKQILDRRTKRNLT